MASKKSKKNFFHLAIGFIIVLIIGLFIGVQYEKSKSELLQKNLQKKVTSLDAEFQAAKNDGALVIDRPSSKYQYNDLLLYSTEFEGKTVYTTHFTYLGDDLYYKRINLTGSDADPLTGGTEYYVSVWIPPIEKQVIVAGGENPLNEVESIDDVEKTWGSDIYTTKEGYKMHWNYHYYAGGYYAVSLEYDYINSAADARHNIFEVTKYANGATIYSPEIVSAKQELMKFADTLSYRKIRN